MTTEFFVVHNKVVTCKDQVIFYISRTRKTVKTAIREFISTKIPNPKQIETDADHRVLVGVLFDPSRYDELERILGKNRLVTIPISQKNNKSETIQMTCSRDNPNIIWLTDDIEGKHVCNVMNTKSSAVYIVSAPLYHKKIWFPDGKQAHVPHNYRNFVYTSEEMSGIDGRSYQKLRKNVNPIVCGSTSSGFCAIQ
jgi:hypothetical protein